MKSKALAAPYLVWMTIFTVVPLAIVAWFAFTDSSGAFTWRTSSMWVRILTFFSNPSG